MSLQSYISLIRCRFPQLSFRVCTSINEGWDSFVLDLDDTYIFKFARRPEVEVQFRKEAHLLPELARRLPIKVPIPKFQKLDPPPPLIMGYKKIHGEKLEKLGTQESNERYASQLTNLLQVLNSFTLDDSKRLEIPILRNIDWRKRYLNFFDKVSINLFPQLSGDCRDRVKESFKSYLEEPRNFSFEPSLIHDDLSSDHILHDSKEHVITGVIDWGDSVFGDPAFDYTGLLNDYGFEFSQLVLKLVGHPPEYLDRAYFYSTLIPLYRALYYIEIGERDNLEDSLKTIATVFHP